jgi:hypothetical protein
VTARIGLVDLETAPSLGWVWGKYDQNVIAFEKNWYILSFSCKWLDEPTVHTRALPDYPSYKKDPEDDRDLVSDLWKFYDAADIVVAHNGDAFDIKKSNARFITHELPPPSSYKTVDTLKIARKHFKFDSNKLGDLGQYLEIGDKLTTTGWKLWEQCMRGDPEAWVRMKEYNAQDVLLLEKVYLKLRPWATSHPNIGLYTVSDDGSSNSSGHSCPTCGSNHVQRRGLSYAKLQVRQRFQCQSCMSWFSGKIVKKSIA